MVQFSLAVPKLFIHTTHIDAKASAKKRKHKDKPSTPKKPATPPAPPRDTRMKSPAWAGKPGTFRTVTEPLRRWIPGHTERHDSRAQLHREIFQAVNLSQHGSGASQWAWWTVVDDCKRHALQLDRQLARCSGDKHPLELLLGARDYDALALLAKELPEGAYGRLRVIKGRTGTYVGETQVVNRQHVAHGLGRSDRCDEIQQGTFVNGYLQGAGQTISRGRRTDATFSRGKPTGTAHTVGPKGVSVSRWAQGVLHGNEEATLASGRKATVTYRNGVVTGYEHMDPDGSHYKGEVDRETWLPHGRGKEVKADGSVYEGAWSNGQRHGDGKWDFSFESPLSGYRYIGPYIQDVPHGRGMFENIAQGTGGPCFYRQGELLTPMPPKLSPFASWDTPLRILPDTPEQRFEML